MFTPIDYRSGGSKRYQSIGRCIYCAAIGQPLTREHIIPKALTGNALIFEAASCKSCQTTINEEVEQFILKTMLGDFRAHIDSPTRNRADRSSMQRVTFFVPSEDGKTKKIHRHIVRSAAPVVLACPRPLEPPGMEVGRLPDAPFKSEPWAWRNEAVIGQTIEAFQKSSGYFGPAAMALSEVSEVRLLRFLAKIAHGYAMGEIGADNFNSFLVPLILGKEDNYGFYIGTQARDPDRSASTVFDLKIAISRRTAPPTVCVNVCLYPSLGTPAFSVIAGQVRGKVDGEATH